MVASIPSAAPNNTNPTRLSPQREAEIRADLDAIPAPPWRWIGSRHAGGPQLVTDHSGRQYLLRAAKPTDHRGDELLDPETDAVVYGDLKFRDRREGEKYSTMRSGNTLAIGRTEYDPDSIVGVANPVARWLEASAQYATELLAEVERLRATLKDAADQVAERDDEIAALAARPSRAEVLREAADFLAEIGTPIHGERTEHERGLMYGAERLRRLAVETTGGAA